MYLSIIFAAASEKEATKEATKILKAQDIETWQIKNFSPVNNNEPEYSHDVEQYKIIVLLTAEQIEANETKAKKLAAKK
jgi:hypothetical protein